MMSREQLQEIDDRLDEAHCLISKYDWQKRYVLDVTRLLAQVERLETRLIEVMGDR
jgi:hypothetical protein